jgi:pilus assembly protein Flp/PilA
MNRLLRFLRDDFVRADFIRDERGATAVEYAVMLALIIGVCITAVSVFGSTANGSWVDTGTKLSGAMGS